MAKTESTTLSFVNVMTKVICLCKYNRLPPQFPSVKLIFHILAGIFLKDRRPSCGGQAPRLKDIRLHQDPINLNLESIINVVWLRGMTSLRLTSASSVTIAQGTLSANGISSLLPEVHILTKILPQSETSLLRSKIRNSKSIHGCLWKRKFAGTCLCCSFPCRCRCS